MRQTVVLLLCLLSAVPAWAVGHDQLRAAAHVNGFLGPGGVTPTSAPDAGVLAEMGGGYPIVRSSPVTWTTPGSYELLSEEKVSVACQLWSGGGNGGLADANDAGGGGGGGYTLIEVPDNELTEFGDGVIYVVVAEGGEGGSSSFFTAGGDGVAVSNGTDGDIDGVFGVGGAQSKDDFTWVLDAFTGGDGDEDLTSVGGGGGSSAGTGADGTDGDGNAGGIAPTGGGNGGNGEEHDSGHPGEIPGGGGGGCARLAEGTFGLGAGGQAIVSWEAAPPAGGPLLLRVLMESQR